MPWWMEDALYLNAIVTDNQTGMTKEYLIERRYTATAQLFLFIFAGYAYETEFTVVPNLYLSNFQELRHRMEEDGFFDPIKPKVAPQPEKVNNKPAVVSVKNTSSAPTYRVVFDNFDNETGLGEYAVVFDNPATFADTRAVRSEVFAYAKELFCEIRPNVSIEDIDIVSWKGRFDNTKGENYYTFTMSLAAVQPFDLAYDNKTRKGYLKVRIDGSDIQATMIWAQRNIEALVNRYNRTLSSSETEIPEGGSYLFEREETTSDGYYIFHFKVVN